MEPKSIPAIKEQSKVASPQSNDHKPNQPFAEDIRRHKESLSLFSAFTDHSRKKLIRDILDRSVMISVDSGHGTGIIIGGVTNMVLTAYHVISDDKGNIKSQIKVKKGNLETQVLRVLKAPHCIDLAIIETKDSLGPGVNLNFSLPEQGEEIVAVGCHFGYPNITTFGSISGINEVTKEDGFKSNIFFIDAATNPGNSGGGVFGSDGKLLGIITQYFSNSMGVVIPSATYIQLCKEHWFIVGVQKT